MQRMADPIPAAVAICVRDRPGGIEVLLGRRSAKLRSYARQWVFPGGAVEPSDAARELPFGPSNPVVARWAAAREAAEESGLQLDALSLQPWSHWTTSSTRPRRFAVWFFVADARVQPEAEPDGAELLEVAWAAPSVWLERMQVDVKVSPATWLTLRELRTYAGTEAVMTAGREKPPAIFVTRSEMDVTSGRRILLYNGDAGWHDGNMQRRGARRRIALLDQGESFLWQGPEILAAE